MGVTQLNKKPMLPNSLPIRGLLTKRVTPIFVVDKNRTTSGVLPPCTQREKEKCFI